MESTLQNLAITDNITEGVRLIGRDLAFRVVTAASSTITVQRSIDGAADTYLDIPDFSETVDGTAEFNLTDFVPGQHVRIKSTADMTTCKILNG